MQTFRNSISCLLIAGLIAVFYSTAEAQDDLILWFPFEGSEHVAEDASGNGIDGNIVGAERVPGKYGKGIAIGKKGQYVEISNVLQPAATIAFWFKPNWDGSDTETYRLFDASTGGIYFMIGKGKAVGNRETTFGFYLEDASDADFQDWEVPATNAIPSAGEWYHLAATWDFDAGVAKFHINGEEVGNVLGLGQFPTLNLNPKIGFNVGTNYNAAHNGADGIIDEFAIYARALTAEEIQEVMKMGFSPGLAFNPSPANGAIIRDTWVSLNWTPGESAVSHDVYFGDNFDDVNAGTGGTFRGNQTRTYFFAGLPRFAYPDGLVPDTTYYWRIDEVETDGVTKHKGRAWSFFVPSGKAHSPYPADGAESTAADVILTWAAGRGAETHTVYLGEDPEAVANAVEGIPQTLSRYYPGELEFDKTYYWRVDEFDGAVTHKGGVWSFTTMPADAFWASAYYVDEGNRVANDGNPGTEARPWKTIGRGVQSLQPGDTLLIKSGTYRETVILTRSGTKAEPIRIRAYPGDEGKVVINAAEPVANWRKCAGPGDCAGNPYWEHIYVADVAALVQSHPDSAFAVRQVFQNGELLKRSRYPEVGWSYPTDVVDPRTTFIDHSLAKPDGYFVGSVCHVKTAVWHLDQIPITDFSQRAITLAKSPRYDISTRFGYYITSIVGEINEEGEWAYDPARKKIFLWPRGDVAEDVEFSYRRYCLRSYSGTSWNVVRGLTMRNAYRYGIYLYRSNDMTLEDNTVEHAYNFGIHLYAGVGATGDNNQIVRNTIEYSAFCGINVDRVCSGTNVEGNYIYATGAESFGADLMNGRGMGILIGGPYTRVYNNMIDRTGHSGIYVTGRKTISRDISYNYVTNTKLALSDGGGIGTGGFSDVPEKDHIHHNIIVDVIGCRTMDRKYDKGLPVTIEKYSSGSAGIFVDRRCNNRIIEHNTVINSHQAGIFLHLAPGNVVQNNTLYGNKKAQIWFSGRDQPGEKLVDEVVFDNIMFATDAQQKTFRLAINYDDVHFGQSDRNYFYNPFSYSHIFVSRYTGEWIQDDLTLQRWRALSGYDANSKEFSYLDQFEDITIDLQKESRIIYNPSLDVIDIDLESDKYCDVDGNKIYGSVSLQPFESKILISSDYEIPQEN